MKKKFIGVSVLATALTLCTGMTAFAGWIQDSHGWYYQNADGSYPKTANWFKDPDTGLEYFLDPDGYMMAGTHVDGFWLDDSGVKHEKTQAQLEAEAAREARVASRPSPAKVQLDAKNAAAAAKKATTAVTTTRLSYQAEMKAFMDKVFIEIRDKLVAKENETIAGDTFEDNLQTTYYYEHKSIGRIITCNLWKSSNKSNANYTPYAFDMTYNRGASDNEEEIAIMDEGFNKLLIAALGENEGKSVYDAIFAEAMGNGASFNRNGNTDTGNSYELTYNNNQAIVKIICSEIVPETEDSAENTENEQQSEESTVEQTTPTTSVIVAGQGKAASEDTAATENSENTEAENPENSSEAASTETVNTETSAE